MERRPSRRTVEKKSGESCKRAPMRRIEQTKKLSTVNWIQIAIPLESQTIRPATRKKLINVCHQFHDLLGVFMVFRFERRIETHSHIYNYTHQCELSLNWIRFMRCVLHTVWLQYETAIIMAAWNLIEFEPTQRWHCEHDMQTHRHKFRTYSISCWMADKFTLFSSNNNKFGR